jgi:N-acetylmuramoyl-L-alanine amidase
MVTRRVALFVVLLLGVGGEAAAQSAKSAYTAALARERAVRVPNASIEKMRAVIQSYEAVQRRYPQSGYSDNALWQAAGLAVDIFKRFDQERDRQTALRLLATLVRGYPASSLRREASALLSQIENAAPKPAPIVATAGRRPAPKPAPRPDVTALKVAEVDEPEDEPDPSAPPPPSPAVLRSITRKAMPDGVRITLELDAEATYHAEQISNPERLFFDFPGVRAASDLRDRTLTFDADVVSEIRLGRRPNETTRVVFDMTNVARHSIFVIHNPYRIVVDCERGTPVQLSAGVSSLPGISAPVATAGDVPFKPALPAGSIGPAPSPASSAKTVEDDRRTSKGRKDDGGSAAVDPVTPNVAATAPSVPAAAVTVPVPLPPSANGSGGFSLARQLGLGVARIVIDPGHGGHDPGAHGRGITESELVLDVAQRLEKLLLKQPGVEVVMTRRSDTYVALEERTAIANQQHADLFLSIHANASPNSKLGGVETYFLDFASSPDAEAVAARENSASGRAMNNLPDIVRAIALNTKLDESRDLAGMVQDAMVKRLSTQHKSLRSLGVKRAPFVVLIGAQMPSVLAEVSFLTNRTEGQLLGTSRYRDRIAEALAEAVLRYRRSLKNVTTAELQ